MTSVSSQLDKAFKTKVLDKLEKTVKAIAFVVDSELVARTPVDTGRAQSNWIPTLNIPSTQTVEAGAKPEIGRTLVDYNLDDNIMITNNLPYIEKLNQGSSKQAPANFVDASVQFAVSIIR